MKVKYYVVTVIDMKQQNKILIMMIGVSVIGIGLPTTFSVGSGQHQFIQINPENPNEFCDRCHGSGDAIQAELMTSGTAIYNSGIRIHASLNCVDCHQIEQGYGNIDRFGQKTEHAALIPSCIKCHTQGTGSITGNVTQELSSTTEAHNSMVYDGDKACIGCHTSVQVYGSITYNYS